MRYILLFSLLAFSSYAQSVGDFSLNYKANATGPQSIKSWAKANSTLWGTNSSGNPQSITVGSGLALNSGVLSLSSGILNAETFHAFTGSSSIATDLKFDGIYFTNEVGFTSTLKLPVGSVSAYDWRLPEANGTIITTGNLSSITAVGGLTSGSIPTYLLTGTLSVANGGTGQTTFTNGQILIGNTTGNTLTKATLTAGSGITITNGNGSITIAATGGSGVTSITGTANEITVTGTTTPTLSLPSALTFTGKTITGGTFASPTLTTPALGTPSAVVLTNATGSPTGITLSKAQLNTILSDDDPAYIGTAQTFSQAQTFSRSGAASVSAISLTGTPFSGGTATTNFPLFRIDYAAAACSNWGSGTAIGVNLANGNISPFKAISLQRDSVEYFSVDGSGNVISGNQNRSVTFHAYTTLVNAIGPNTANRGLLMGSDVTGIRMASDYSINWSSSAAGSGDAFSNLDIGLARNSAGVLRVSNGSSGLGALNTGTLTVGTSGTAFAQIRRYSLTMVAGTVTQADTAVTANTLIIADRRTVGGTIGHISTSVSAGSSFTINSSSSAETSTFTITVIVFP